MNLDITSSLRSQPILANLCGESKWNKSSEIIFFFLMNNYFTRGYVFIYIFFPWFILEENQ